MNASPPENGSVAAAPDATKKAVRRILRDRTHAV
jgi:hypothetical protein